MLAIFHCWVPGFRHAKLPPDLELVLSGDTAEALAWDLIELFFDAVTMHECWTWADAERARPAQVIDPRRLDSSLAVTQAYQALRFTPSWWRRQEWRVGDRLSGGTLGLTGIARFQELFPPQALLGMYLADVIGKYYAPHHGLPRRKLDAEHALAYFRTHGYLRNVGPGDLPSLGPLPAG